MSSGPAGVGVLALVGRGDLPFALLDRRPLFVHALMALAQTAHDLVVAVDEAQAARVADELARAGLALDVRPGGWWDVDEHAGSPLLVHDPLCPLVGPDFLSAVHDLALRRPEASFAAFRPVTDTVKTVVDGTIQETLDRDLLAALTAPVVLGAAVVAAADTPPPIADFAELVAWARGRAEVELVKAPSLARRVDDESAVAFLECVDELSRRTRHEHHPRG